MEVCCVTLSIIFIQIRCYVVLLAEEVDSLYQAAPNPHTQRETEEQLLYYYNCYYYYYYHHH